MKSLLLLLLLIAGAAWASEVPPALMRACAGDARRLCGPALRAHDMPAVRLCMLAAATQVSARCSSAWRAAQGS